MGILLDLIIILILILCIFLGYKKGLINVGFNLFAFVLSLLISIVLYSPITNFIINNTQLDENIEEIVIKNITKENEESEENNNGISAYIQGYAKDITENAQNAVTESVARTIAINVIGICVMIVIFIITRLLLLIIRSIADIIANLPIVKQFNKTGGVLYGILKGLIIIYVILAIAFFIVSVNGNSQLYSIIESSIITKVFYNNNIILNILF